MTSPDFGVTSEPGADDPPSPQPEMDVIKKGINITVCIFSILLISFGVSMLPFVLKFSVQKTFLFFRKS
jgi:hypothetical protein